MVEYRIEQRQDISIVHLTGRLDLANVDVVKPVFQQLIEDECTDILVDLDGLTFMDSSGLSLIVGTFKRIRVGKGDLKLAGLSPTIQKLFEITRLSRVFEIFETTEQGVASFAA